jgi:hypothetical protein
MLAFLRDLLRSLATEFAPALSITAAVGSAWLVALHFAGPVFGSIGLLVSPFLGVYLFLFLLLFFSRDRGPVAESKDDLNRLLDRKRVVGYVVRSRCWGRPSRSRPAPSAATDTVMERLLRHRFGGQAGQS